MDKAHAEAGNQAENLSVQLYFTNSLQVYVFYDNGVCQTARWPKLWNKFDIHWHECHRMICYGPLSWCSHLEIFPLISMLPNAGVSDQKSVRSNPQP